MTGGYLFAGIGGFELASQWAGITPVWSNEIDPYCCKVLHKNFNHEIIQADIRECGEGRKYPLKPVDIICGGFPCQPFSHAGKRKGTEDDRYLWPEMLRIIREVKPQWIIGENVAGLLSMENGKTLERICVELEDSGYTVQPYIIPAAGVGAWHRRDRVWIVAHAVSKRLQSMAQRLSNKNRIFKKRSFDDITRLTPTTWTQRPSDNGTIRRSNGIPRRVDRLKALGNAIVPQVAFELFKAINH